MILAKRGSGGGMGLGALALVVGLAFGLGGCWSQQKRSAQSAEDRIAVPIAADRWPGRDVEVVRPLYEQTPELVGGVEMSDEVGTKLGEALQKSLRSSGFFSGPSLVEQMRRPEWKVTYKGLHGVCLVRVLERPSVEESEAGGASALGSSNRSWSDLLDTLSDGFVPNARSMSSRTISGAAASEARRARMPKSATDQVFGTFPTDLRDNNSETKELLKQTTRRVETDAIWLTAGKPIRVPDVKKEGEPPYRGVVLHFTAMYGNPYEPKVMEAFRKRGWAVFDLSTEKTIEPPLVEPWLQRAAEARAKSDAIWKTIKADVEQGVPREEIWRVNYRKYMNHPSYKERSELEKEYYQLTAGAFLVTPETDLEAMGAQIAAEVDQALAGNAYAAEAMVDYIKKARPDLRGLPIAMIGLSAGALTTPAAAARIHDDLCAVVLVGGGANILNLATQSVFSDGGLRLRVNEKDKPSNEVLKKIEAAYLKSSVLDPYYTAAAIRDLPVLQLHASHDKYVPSEGGDLLWERLGKPERWTILGGHEFLFFFLPQKADAIARWVDDRGKEWSERKAQ